MGNRRRYADLSEIRSVKIRQSFDTCIFFGSIGPEFPSCMRDRPAVPYFIICYHVVCQIAISKKAVGETYASIYSGGRTLGTRNARSVPRVRCAVRHRNLLEIFAGVRCRRGFDSDKAICHPKHRIMGERPSSARSPTPFDAEQGFEKCSSCFSVRGLSGVQLLRTDRK